MLNKLPGSFKTSLRGKRLPKPIVKRPVEFFNFSPAFYETFSHTTIIQEKADITLSVHWCILIAIQKKNKIMTGFHIFESGEQLKFDKL